MINTLKLHSSSIQSAVSAVHIFPPGGCPQSVPSWANARGRSDASRCKLIGTAMILSVRCIKMYQAYPEYCISRVYPEYIQRVGITTGPRLTRLHMLRTLTPRLLPFLDVYLLYQVRQVPVSTGRLFFLSLTINCFECSTQSLLWDKTVTAN